jgi:hypothetical protein
MVVGCVDRDRRSSPDPERWIGDSRSRTSARGRGSREPIRPGRRLPARGAHVRGRATADRRTPGGRSRPVVKRSSAASGGEGLVVGVRSSRGVEAEGHRAGTRAIGDDSVIALNRRIMEGVQARARALKAEGRMPKGVRPGSDPCLTGFLMGKAGLTPWKPLERPQSVPARIAARANREYASSATERGAARASIENPSLACKPASASRASRINRTQP